MTSDPYALTLKCLPSLPEIISETHCCFCKKSLMSSTWIPIGFGICKNEFADALRLLSRFANGPLSAIEEALASAVVSVKASALLRLTITSNFNDRLY